MPIYWWSQKSGVIQGYELSVSKTYNIGDGDLLVMLSRDDISGIFDDNTYIPRITPAKNVLSLKYENQKNDAYHLDFIYTESQGDMSSIETKTNSHVDLDIGYSKKIVFDSHLGAESSGGGSKLGRSRRRDADSWSVF